MRKLEHPIHSLSTYLGSFPPRVPRRVIEKWTAKRSTVLDPFCGSGTTLVEANLGGRRGIGVDLNPLAVALSRARIQRVHVDDVVVRVNALAREFSSLHSASEAPDDIKVIFHEYTLAQLCFLRQALGDKEPEDVFLRGCVLGIMHGKSRKDGGTAYLSIDMPNTFSMSPQYVRDFVKRNQLTKPRVDVFAKLRDRARWLLRRGSLASGPRAEVLHGDAARIDEVLESRGVRSVGAVVTSPPYLGVLRYGAFNWIRLWFLGYDQYTVDKSLDSTDSLDLYLSFMASFLTRLGRVQVPGGVAALVIGDVDEFGHQVNLAERVWEELGGVVPYEAIAIDADEYDVESKTTRIWGADRKGRATPLDRILVLRRINTRSPRTPKAGMS